MSLMRWQPRIPDLTPHDLFLLAFVKFRVFVPPLTSDLQALKYCGTTAAENVTRIMLQ